VDLALADLEAGLALRPEDARLRHFHAMTLLEAGAFTEAGDAFRAAGRVGAPPAEVACGVGTAAYFDGDRAGARRAFLEAVAADPRFPLGRYNLAALDVEEGKGGREGLAVARSLLARGRPHGYLLSPWPPLDGMEAELLRLRRGEQGL
jgi:Flp pilus assembly protein TadD